MTSQGLFVDTSGWAHFLDANQPLHLFAVALVESHLMQDKPLLTTNYIIAELIALLHSPLRISRPRAIEMVESLISSSFVEIVHVDPALDKAAWQLLRTRPDKSWSLADCASFVVMRQNNINEVLTTDPHFEQAGYTRLLK
jgi:predicted nucleic acid-binding protein